MLVGDKIASLRKQNNLSQDQLADALGVARNTVSRWESGSVIPSVETLKKLCEYFNIGMEALLDKNQPEEELSVTEEREDKKKKILLPVWQIILIVFVGLLCLVAVTAAVILGMITLPMLSDNGLVAYTDDLDPAHFFIALAITLFIVAAEFAITFVFIKKAVRRVEV